MIKDFQKLKIHLEGQLSGLKWHRALRAMNIARKYHTGLRKNGSPEFQHQVEIALYMLTLPIVELDVEELIVLVFLHDVMEDYGVTIEDVAFGKDKDGEEFNFGVDTAIRVHTLSKVYRGEKRDTKKVMEGIAACPYCSLVKGGDRVHNHGTMAGAFKLEKIISYSQTETKDEILPMLKKARKRFPKNAPAYFNMENILYRDIYMIEQLVNRFITQKAS